MAHEAIGSRIGYQAAQAGLFLEKPGLSLGALWRNIFCRSLDAACVEECFQLIAFVIMPEHVHLLTLPLDAEAKVSRLLARTKQPTSRQIHRLLREAGSTLLDDLIVTERPGKRTFRFWQEGPGFDRNLFSPDAILASIDYIHENPVRHSLCQRAVDFKWSSARFHLRGELDPDLPSLSRIDPEWIEQGGMRFEPT